MFNHVFQIHCLKLTYTWKILFFLENPCIFGRVFVVNSSHLSRPSPGMPHLKRVSTSESPDPKWMRENLCLHLHENSWKSKGKVARTPPPNSHVSPQETGGLIFAGCGARRRPLGALFLGGGGTAAAEVPLGSHETCKKFIMK